ncbi:MarR family winged helix-turn-helix transcriptional regulator [Pseudonocardia sp. N23]|uniref:MarR family winged helix-turn-helix transcriptional regulator n=1 Tax=Pseudonocardia sp. N23 TaxID=1987376 RepID=UPI000C02429D|nr:MarR family winged helix-turn-helix transcriptional regulator [Pseudonocardia sp. N23]GAY08428.1 transcriptional regulator, MarR family [Pseudonocardia sp. N23]
MTSAAISTTGPTADLADGPAAGGSVVVPIPTPAGDLSDALACDLAVADALGYELARLFRLVQRTSRGSGPADLDRATFHVLIHLASADGPQRSADLAEALCTDPSTVSRRVAALVKQGLIERRADPDDGRASLLAVTDDGHSALEQSRRYKARLVAEVLGAWPIEKRQALVALLADFCTDFQQHDMSPGPVARRH